MIRRGKEGGLTCEEEKGGDEELYIPLSGGEATVMGRDSSIILARCV